ncbi:MAG: restriction endonuclease subunit S [Prevotellaceae bacterium]|nr:restriction endonuclease subunit S [Prevotellaceae bacterium]
MDYRNILISLGFSPKENVSDVFSKVYRLVDNYTVEVDFEKNTINYGSLIQSDRKTTQNFSQPENFVVLECVNRLLEKGYKPQNIILEKTYPAGRGTTKRLDILVKKDDEPYLMIECKTYGEEFEKELKNIKKNGGQLFTYFQQDTKVELLMLYASDIINNPNPEYRIIKIEEEFRNAGNVKNVIEFWDKEFHEKGFWENPPYNFHVEIFTKSDLKELTEAEGNKLFNGFASILRKHSVSDKPNAFNVIFNLFLAKLYDEQKRDTDELEFYWHKDDDPVDFQVRLYNLHAKGLNEFLKKEIEGIRDEDFRVETPNELKKAKKKFLKFNKLFDIKSVLDDNDFEQNHRVLKAVVEMLQKYQIRYPRKQRHLSDFFELLLTTGLKQEAGQYFTPPPVAKFIIKSLPIHEILEKEINQEEPKLPVVIDYATGSGHFITEILEEYQDIIDGLDTSNYFPKAKQKVKTWSKDGDPYSWAAQYVYGIEKDYRLVKVAKVGCYFYGDGLAQIVHGDGLDSFANSKSYIGLLKDNIHTEDSAKNKFSIVVSNPPYSVKDCKDDLEYIGAEKDFELYNSLTDNSSEIECLFVERTKQLLKDGGVAGVILPSSILSNDGIYAKAREIILQYFEIIAITELGSNTFMATGTNTVVLFLRRRNNYDSINLRKSVERFFDDYQDVTRNGIENPVAKYVNHVWENITIDDYITLLKKEPNSLVANHEIYKEYRKKIKAKTEKDFWNTLIETEKEKLYYFILACPQRVVLVKTGEKDAEKRFLGYEFSNRRGSEGIHPIQRGKTIDECTRLFDDERFDNPEKAATYIYKAFSSDYDFPVHESLKDNISRVRLVDMLTFDRESFVKNISTVLKKKVIIETKWNLVDFEKIAQIVRGVTYSKRDQTVERTEKIILTADNITLGGFLEIKKQVYLYNDFEISKEKKLKKNDIFICFSSGSKEHLGKVAFVESDTEYYAGGFMAIIRVFKEINPKFTYLLFNTLLRQTIRDVGSGSNINNLSSVINNVKIPLPPLSIQQQIVSEIEVLEKKEAAAKGKIEKDKERIEQLFTDAYNIADKTYRLSNDIFDISIGKRVIEVDLNEKGTIPVYSANVFMPFGYIDKLLIDDFSVPSVLWGIDGDWQVNYMPTDKTFYPTDHCGVLRIKTNEILPKYLAWVLNKVGIEQKFSRTLRASIDRIKGLSIKVPPLPEQQKIVAEIEKIEAEIAKSQKIVDEMPALKNEILKKYL